jgi:hypothetical protein
MSNEHTVDDINEEPDDTTGAAGAEGEPGEPSATASEPGHDEVDVEDAPETAEGGALAVALAQRRERNALVRGRVVLHYPSRDVTFDDVDGDAAMRILSLCAGTVGAQEMDDLHPMLSSARALWMVFDERSPLAVTWTPHPLATRTKATIDPATAGAAIG